MSRPCWRDCKSRAMKKDGKNAIVIIAIIIIIIRLEKQSQRQKLMMKVKSVGQRSIVEMIIEDMKPKRRIH